jgi:3,4-dihydroxy 2-butanone 4-phosphate synthase/GTP cyclohydrolase II
MPFAPIPEVIAAIAAGTPIVLVDDEDRENEGDLVIAADFADEANIAFMATKACGLICLTLEGGHCDRLGLPLMTRNNGSQFQTAFTLSIEAASGVTTGISAADRAHTIQTAIQPDARPDAIVSPGHVFPIRAMSGGVLVRAGHSEASVDLARLAGRTPAGVICEIMRPDGQMARLPDLEIFCQEHGLLLASIADLIAWRERQECLVELSAEAAVDTEWGPARAFSFHSTLHPDEHLAVVFGDHLGHGHDVDEPVLVRVQREAPLADVLGIYSGPAAVQSYLPRLAEQAPAVLLYLRDTAQLPHALVRHGGRAGTIPTSQFAMDPRQYGIGAQILRALGVRKMRLMASGDRPLSALDGYGLEVVERISI